MKVVEKYGIEIKNNSSAGKNKLSFKNGMKYNLMII